jgi:hypothetical protein
VIVQCGDMASCFRGKETLRIVEEIMKRPGYLGVAELRDWPIA